LLVLFDFSYQHYALGDVLTTQVNLAVMAIEQRLAHVDIVVAVNPYHPRRRCRASSRRPITSVIMSVFSCNPLIRSMRLVRDVRTLNALISSHHHLDEMPMWPDLEAHLKMR